MQASRAFWMKQGLTVRLEGALTSELLMCEAVK